MIAVWLILLVNICGFLCIFVRMSNILRYQNDALFAIVENTRKTLLVVYDRLPPSDDPSKLQSQIFPRATQP